MLTRSKRRFLFWVSVAVFFILIIPVLLYSLGYRLGPGFELSKTGGIYIEASETGAEIFVDGAKKKSTSLFGESALIRDLRPGLHKVAVKKDGFLDWTKEVNVTAENVFAKTALLIPQNADGKILDSYSAPPAEFTLKKNKLYGQDAGGKTAVLFPGVKNFWKFPDKNSLLILGEDGNFYKNGDVFKDLPDETFLILKNSKNSFFDVSLRRVIYWEGLNINSYWVGDMDKMPEWEIKLKESEGQSAQNLSRKFHIFSASTPIKNVFFYPGRDNYLLVAVTNGIWALEMDSSGGQNMPPVYQGKNPKIIYLNDKTVVILDDGRYIEIKLP